MFWLILLAVTAAGSVLMTARLRQYAIRSGLVDRPNARSSHSMPTPRGGGLAIVVTSLLAAGLLSFLHVLPLRIFAALAGGLPVAIVGFVDDRHTVPAAVRLVVHVCAALWCLAWLRGLPLLRFGDHVVQLGWAGYVLGAFAIVWVLNLFNFMDGIDGIAASEAIFVTGAGALMGSSILGAGAPPAGATWSCAAVVAAACAGFLVWNWPPAKIFMGDVGSGYLGYTIAALALAAGHENPAAVWVWLILGGVFFVDATATLARRTLRGDKFHEAHRSHAYQWLARRWGAHQPVTLAVLAVNVLWLLPSAWLALIYPGLAWWILLTVLTPLVILAFIAGAGRQEALPL